MKIMTIGGNGRIGKYMAKWVDGNLDCDITNPYSVDDTLSKERPTHILHLAAKSDIDWCEKPENEKEAIAINVRGTFNVLTSAEKIGAKVVMLSSDHVFKGGKGGWWGGGPYDENDKPFPVNFYGTTKLAAESFTEAFDNFKVIRTSYLFDWERLQSKIGQPQPTFIERSFMYLPDFCSDLVMYLRKYDEMPKILHISGSRTVSWYEFMSSFTRVSPRTTENKSMTKRPYRAGLKTKYKFFYPVSYEAGVKQMLKDAV